MIVRVMCKGSSCHFSIEKKLFVYDPVQKNVTGQRSGIRATIFGPSGSLGLPIAAILGEIGSKLILPVSNQYHYRHSEHLKELKVVGTVNQSWLQWDMNFKNQDMIDNMVKNSNVVINLIGPRKNLKKKEDIQFVNLQIASRIAHSCLKYNVHRLIHFSAAGAEPNSSSFDFQTKYQAQSLVKNIFPNATIFRPCPTYGLNDWFASLIMKQSKYFMNRVMFTYDDLSAIKQPILNHDVAKCVLNALKLQETKGKTYQLGGPHKLTYLQIHEIIFNILKVKPRIAYINRDWAMKVAHYIYNWQFFGEQYFRKRLIQQTVKSNQYRTIQELYVQPVSFKHGVYEILRDYVANYKQKEEEHQN